MPSPASRPPSPKVKLGDIVADALPGLWSAPWLSEHQASVLSRMARCSTGALGSMYLRCEECGNKEWRPLGCQDRHCPSCGVRRTEEWAQARVEELLDVPYFHLVFTVPGDLYPLFFDNQRELYGLLFSTAHETLSAFFDSTAHIRGTPAYFCVLHTTNRRLGYHPHLHVVVAGAAFDESTGKLKVVPNDDFLFPARALAASFRGRFLTGLRALARGGRLDLQRGSSRRLAEDRPREAFFSELFAVNWQLRIDAVKGDVERVIRYLARYTYRTAISNARIAGYVDGQVTYTWRHRKTRRRQSATLPLHDFVRRFAQHILPKGFKRTRFYGLLSPARRAGVLPLAQAAAQRRARGGALLAAVRCSIRPERLPAMCCEACGAEAMRALVVSRGSRVTELHPPTLPQPPPGTLRSAERGAT